jgi:alpha-beta hydrolase superfamily lysophospholipase
MRYNFAMETKDRNHFKSKHFGTPPNLGGNLLTDADRDLKISKSGELYRFLCPVDHQNNSVLLRGIRHLENIQRPPILVVHDVSERSLMYWDSMNYMCDQGYSSYCYDQRGHGVDADISGHLDHFEDLVNDLLQVTSWVRHLHNGVPPILVGQGYGAIVATMLASKHPKFVTGIVLAAPTIELAWRPGPAKQFLIRVMSHIAPRIKVPGALHPRFSNPLHRDVSKTLTPGFLRSLIGPKPLRLTFAFSREIFEAMDSFPRFFHSLSKPTLVLTPDNDEVATYEAMNSISAAHPKHSLVTNMTVKNVRHNGFTEGKLPLETILDCILSWIDTATSASISPSTSTSASTSISEKVI